MKQIAYTITDSGIDGREPTRIVQAFWDEALRDARLENDKNKAYRSTGEVIVDSTPRRAQALAKLDGLDRLVLELEAKE